jgi:biopolymer transport protein ExbB/TolQ
MDLTNFGLQVLAGLSPILISLVIALLGFGLNFLKKKAKEIDNNVIRKSVLSAVSEVDKVAKDAVRKTSETFTKSLKEANEDGKLTQDEARKAMEQAKNYIKNNTSNYALEIVKNNIGSLEYYLEDLLEAKLVEMKDGQVITEIKGISNPNLSSQ